MKLSILKINKITCLHVSLYEIVQKICLRAQQQKDWWYTGVTFLIPKTKAERGSDFGLIICMPNLYKVATKCVTQVLQSVVTGNKRVAEIQL